MTSENQIDVIIQACRDILPEDAIKEVDHFFGHGEYEMAFEGLVIELMKADVVPHNYDYDEWCTLMRSLKLDDESSFDGEFWSKFLVWGQTKHGRH